MARRDLNLDDEKRSYAGLWLLGATLLVLGAMVWVLVEQSLLDLTQPNVTSWIALVVLALVLGIGMSWSLVRRRLTGQIDVDSVDR